jgi:hypothetical protein
MVNKLANATVTPSAAATSAVRVWVRRSTPKQGIATNNATRLSTSRHAQSNNAKPVSSAA